MPEVNQALAMPLGHGALALGERRRWAKRWASGYDRAYVLPNSFKSALVPFLPASNAASAGAVKCAMAC